MYLIYDNVTGEALKAFNIPVEGNYIEISPEQWTEICENNEKFS